MNRYEAIPHTADTGIIAYGSTLDELFENAAFGMFDLMADLSGVLPCRDRPITAVGDTVEELLVDWLGQLITEAEIHDLIFSTFTVDWLEEGGVGGVAGGSPGTGMTLIGPPIKAVTYHDLAVVEISDGWWARLVFDV